MLMAVSSCMALVRPRGSRLWLRLVVCEGFDEARPVGNCHVGQVLQELVVAPDLVDEMLDVWAMTVLGLIVVDSTLV